MNDDWRFRFSHQVNRGDVRRVDLPHTWDAQDALAGRPDYKRGIGNYTKRLYVRPEWAGKRLFLRFEGANSIADLFVDGRHVGEHRGGYGAFVFEITDRVQCGREHTIEVRVNNGEQLDVMPLVGDFNFYGGIYRDVHLLVTDSLCISPLDCASPGLFLVQQAVGERRAEVSARIELSNAAERPQPAVVDRQCRLREGAIAAGGDGGRRLSGVLAQVPRRRPGGSGAAPRRAEVTKAPGPVVGPGAAFMCGAATPARGARPHTGRPSRARARRASRCRGATRTSSARSTPWRPATARRASPGSGPCRRG